MYYGANAVLWRGVVLWPWPNFSFKTLVTHAWWMWLLLHGLCVAPFWVISLHIMNYRYFTWGWTELALQHHSVFQVFQPRDSGLCTRFIVCGHCVLLIFIIKQLLTVSATIYCKTQVCNIVQMSKLVWVRLQVKQQPWETNMENHKVTAKYPKHSCYSFHTSKIWQSYSALLQDAKLRFGYEEFYWGFDWRSEMSR
jgi:hypothetical protein